MVTETFHKLKKEKKKQFTDAFLREFSLKTYDEASITAVVKSLGIAKGSVYQYFEDKQALFMYLIEVCSSTKLKYIGHLKREDYKDYWTYFRQLYQEGVRFDLEHPLASHFLHNLNNNINAPSLKEMYRHMMRQTVDAFEQMVRKEITLKLFRDDIPLNTMAFMLYSAGIAIQKQMLVQGTITPEESIKNDTPVYQDKAMLLMQTVDEYISLLKPAFNKQKNDAD